MWSPKYVTKCSPQSNLQYVSCTGLNCVPPEFLAGCVLKSLASNVTIFGNRNFKEVSNVKWGPEGGAIVQYDWFPYKKRKRCVQIKGHLRIPLEDSHLQAKERGLRRNQIHGNLDFRLPACSMRRKCISAISATQPVFRYGSPSKLIQYSNGKPSDAHQG